MRKNVEAWQPESSQGPVVHAEKITSMTIYSRVEPEVNRSSFWARRSGSSMGGMVQVLTKSYLI